MSDKVVVFHANCHDGVAAAWVCKRRFPDAEMYPASYDQPPDLDRLRGKDVIVVDFSWKRGPMLDVAKVARTILVLDHHKTAESELVAGPTIHGEPGFWIWPKTWSSNVDHWTHAQSNCAQDIIECGIAHIQTIFDMNRSGAGLAWDFFFPKDPRPTFIDLVEDRDLWQFKFPNTKKFHAGNSAEALTYEARKDLYDEFQREDTPRALMEIVSAGNAILSYHDKLVNDLVSKRVRVELINPEIKRFADLDPNPDKHLAAKCAEMHGIEPYWEVYAVCHPLMAMVSDVGEQLCEYGDFGMSYWYEPERGVWQFSLRSRGDFDVSEVAKCFGGGGHKNAAGFTVKSLDGVLLAGVE